MLKYFTRDASQGNWSIVGVDVFLEDRNNQSFFQSAGTLHCFKEAWYINESIGATLLAVSLNKQEGIPSGLHTLNLQIMQQIKNTINSDL